MGPFHQKKNYKWNYSAFLRQKDYFSHPHQEENSNVMNYMILEDYEEIVISEESPIDRFYDSLINLIIACNH